VFYRINQWYMFGTTWRWVNDDRICIFWLKGTFNQNVSDLIQACTEETLRALKIRVVRLVRPHFDTVGKSEADSCGTPQWAVNFQRWMITRILEGQQEAVYRGLLKHNTLAFSRQWVWILSVFSCYVVVNCFATFSAGLPSIICDN